MNLDARIADAKDWARAAPGNPLFWTGLAIAAASIAVDQATKAWVVHGLDLPARRQIDISPIFDLTYVRNFGASFGMGADHDISRIIFSLIAVGISGAMVAWLGRLKRTFAAVGAGLVIGGAIGNLIDRVRQGFVTDFLDFSGLYFPWVFNVADVSINLGILCLVIDYFRHEHGAKSG